MKKTIAFIMFLCLCAGLLAGCGGETKKNAGSNEIKELKIAVSPYQDAETEDRKSTRLNSSHPTTSRMPSSA